mmetsp:Transcript_58965/g.97779  ORF Transcript_58965/g.97779 Transcript_58965/m.97779 type:complete len:225 (+) Transcript_58965:169-843(+)
MSNKRSWIFSSRFSVQTCPSRSWISAMRFSCSSPICVNDVFTAAHCSSCFFSFSFSAEENACCFSLDADTKSFACFSLRTCFRAFLSSLHLFPSSSQELSIFLMRPSQRSTMFFSLVASESLPAFIVSIFFSSRRTTDSIRSTCLWNSAVAATGSVSCNRVYFFWISGMIFVASLSMSLRLVRWTDMGSSLRPRLRSATISPTTAAYFSSGMLFAVSIISRWST